MIGWQKWAYAFPLDDVFDALAEVINEVPREFMLQLEYRSSGLILVTPTDATAAVYLRMAFGQNDLTGADGESNLEGHEVLVLDQQRDECEALLRDACPSDANWFDLVFIFAQSHEAHRAFHDAYRAVIGHPTAIV